MCGIVVAHSLHDCYGMMSSLQPRGRDAAGMVLVGDRRIDCITWLGLVKDFSLRNLYRIFHVERYHTFLGHTRYGTKGRKDQLLRDAHPQTIGGSVHDYGHHCIILDCDMAIVHNGQVDDEYFAEINKSKLPSDCSDTLKLLHYYKERNEYEIMQKIPGAYTLAIADKRRPEVIVMRDRTGIKPSALGKKDGKYCIASEDIALSDKGAEFKEYLEPGCIYYMLPSDSKPRSQRVVKPQIAYCFFEWNYIAQKETVLNRISVKALRQTLGEILARESRIPETDYIAYMPECPEAAAEAYSRISGIPLREILYKIRNERAFQGSTSEEREHSISTNLFLNLEAINKIRGKTITLIDDSIVRGNNACRARKLLYEEAQVANCHLLNYTPPIGLVGSDNIPRGCMFGVDMPPNESPNHQFIARGKNLEEIGTAIGMPVHYISVHGMLRGFKSLGMPREHLCTYCIGGKHPFKTT